MSSQDADLSCHNFHHTQSNWYILPLSAESPHISHRTLEINKEQIIYGKYTLCWIIVSAVLMGSGVVGYLQKCKHKSQSTWSNVFMCVGGWCIWLMSLLLICNEILWEKKAILLTVFLTIFNRPAACKGVSSVVRLSLCFNRGKRGPWQADLRQTLRKTPTPTSSDTVFTSAFLLSLLFLWQTAGIPLLDCSLTITFIIWAHYKSLQLNWMW